MVILKLLTILLTCTVYMDHISLAVARSSSLSSGSFRRLIKRELNSKACGVRGSDMPTESQIVGGEQSSLAWPWMLSVAFGFLMFFRLQLKTLVPKASISREGSHICGGSVLDNRHVITAAHCFEDNETPEDFTVTVGHMEQGEGLTFKIQNILLHEEYSRPPNFHNDIALVILEEPLPPSIIPICLPEDDSIADDETLTITGFGALEEGGKPSETLQEVHEIPYINSENCNNIMMELLIEKAEVTENQLCTGADQDDQGSCQGDSGGPVIHKQPDNSWTLVGLVSYSIGCARPGVPTVHTRLHAYRDWIQEHMDE